jgi:CopG family transcriptional regulator/antitoxin EndoAI
VARKTKIVNLSLPYETYKQVEELADRMEVSKSELLREALKQYVASERRWQQIRRWGEETAKRLSIKDEDDVDRIIHEFRQEKPRC